MYTVATRSGVMVAPLLGGEAAGAVFEQEPALLAPFRPSRFTDGTADPARVAAG